ncbi:hypothetical protein JVT61DRAFT_1707 [Boletus reticuloceps]|uniref:Uncharacterized protein n=1 Tax=Boletus reticuloceps TaxID=495285 RepID=A0A8I2YRS8_9AGAM|nr:hypothetical protein JVT61DRAFT_1707 [Boletus reticuloceps]
MTHFKRFFSRFLHPKSRRQLRQRGAVTPTTTNVVTSGEPGSLRGRAHPVPEPTDQNVVQPFTDAVVEEVEESEGESEAHDTHLAVDVQTAQPSTDAILTKSEEVEQHQDGDEHDEYDEEEEHNMPKVFPHDLARKPYHEMITQHLCIAMTDDDREIAALRPLGRERFTHIVRVVFDPPSRNNIMPSSWRAQIMCSNSGGLELRLTCPALTLGYDGKLTALNEKQIRDAHDFIKHAMPERNDAWVE